MSNRRSVVMWVMGLALVSVGASVWAGDPPKDDHEPGHGRAKPISYEEFLERCAHPDEFDVQRQPQNIRVQCYEQRLNWLAEQPGTIPLTGSRKIVSGILADKYFVRGSSSEAEESQGKGGTCMRYRQVEETLLLETPVTCDVLTGLKSTLAEYCASALTSAKNGGSKLVEQRETGKKYDTCGNWSDDREPRDPR